MWKLRLRRAGGAEFSKVSDISCCQGLEICAEGGSKPLKCFEKGNKKMYALKKICLVTLWCLENHSGGWNG